MKLPRRKNANWDMIRMERRLKRWLNRFKRRILIRYYIKDSVDDVLRAIDSSGVYADYYRMEFCEKESLLALRLIAMMYGFGFEMSEYKGNLLFDTMIKITRK